MKEVLKSPRLKRLNELYTLKKLLTSFLFYISILVFIISFNFSDTPTPSGWYQQWMPNLNGRQITDITFLDSLTGYAVTNNLSPGDTGYILKTINGGDNWNFSFTVNRSFTAIKFVNINTGYACGGSGGGTTYLCRTINGGINWSLVNSPSAAKWKDMSVLSYDTLWLVDDDALTGGVYRTTNGGGSWDRQFNNPSLQPEKIYMYNSRIGFIARNGSYIRKTTDGGYNWTVVVSGNDGFRDMYFTDSLTGWKAYYEMKKTTNGGLNWTTQVTAQGGIIQTSFIFRFSNINRDTIWGTGGYVMYPNNQIRGLLLRTTNGGNNWLFQVPDTTIHLTSPAFIDFADRLKGWGYMEIQPTGIHTTTGGGDTFYTPVKQISSNIPNEFKLFQNYPNPFNSNSKFRISVPSGKFGNSKLAKIKIVVYDITGRTVTTLLEENLSPGEYEISFDGTNYPSGVYFYSLHADGKLIDTKRMILIK